MLCRSACFKRQIFVRQVVCLFVLFTCFRPLLLTCPTVEGRHTVSHLLYCGSLSFGRQVPAVNQPPRPSLGVVCLVERVTMRYMVSDRLSQYINLLYHPTTPPFLVPSVLYPVNQMSAWTKIPIHRQFCSTRPTSTSHLSSQPLRVDVAVLSTSSRGQDPTFSSVWLTSSCRIWYHHTWGALIDHLTATTTRRCHLMRVKQLKCRY